MSTDIDLINVPVELNNTPDPFKIEIELPKIISIPLWYVKTYSYPNYNKCTYPTLRPNNNQTTFNFTVDENDSKVLTYFFSDLKHHLHLNENIKIISRHYKNNKLSIVETIQIKNYNYNYIKEGVYENNIAKDYITLNIIPSHINYEYIN